MKSVYDVARGLRIKPNVIGWKNALSPVLAEFVKGAKIVVEVGSFAGKSVIFMAQNAPEATFFCCDTWLAPGLQTPGVPRDPFGAPMLYEQFLVNIIDAGIESRVTPIRQNSTAGLKMLADAGTQADLVYIDGGHAYSECYIDLIYTLPILAPGAVIVADDVNADFPGVFQACNLFSQQEGFAIEVRDQKAILRRTK